MSHHPGPVAREIRSSARDSRLRKASALPPSSAAIPAQSNPWFLSSSSRRSSGDRRRWTSWSRSRASTSRLGLPAGGDQPVGRLIARADAAVITALGVLLARLRGELVPGHGREQLEQLLRGLQLVLPRGHPDEEAGQDRLADVHRFKHAPEPRIGKPKSHGAADRRLVGPDQLRGRIGVAGTDSSDQRIEGGSINHDHTPE